MSPLLAYTPFIDPLDAHSWWWAIVIPMTILISIAYKAVRTSDMSNYAREVVTMSAQVILGVIGLGLFFFVIVVHLIPMLAPAPEF